MQVDAVALLSKQHVKTTVQQPFPMHARAHAGFVEQVHGHLLEHSGPDTSEHIVGALSFDDHRVDAGAVQQLTEQ